MLILKITSQNKKAVLAEAARTLVKSGVIVYPTETAYGLGADSLNQQAVQKVYRIKGRSFSKPLPLIVASLRMAGRYVHFNQLALALARKYWPGPLTLVLKFKVKSSKSKVDRRGLKILSKDGKIGIRVSGSRLARALARKLGQPITATSANLAGGKECYSLEEVIRQFKNRKYQPDLILDGGRLPRVKPSTVVEVVEKGLKVLRRGPIKIKSEK